MDLWLNIALDDLLRLLPRVDCLVLNDGEAHQLTKDDNILTAMKKIHKLGPKYVIIKKVHTSRFFPVRADISFASMSLQKVSDPTGAGAGPLSGYDRLSARAATQAPLLRRTSAAPWFMAASFACFIAKVLRPQSHKIKRADMSGVL